MAALNLIGTFEDDVTWNQAEELVDMLSVLARGLDVTIVIELRLEAGSEKEDGENGQA